MLRRHDGHCRSACICMWAVKVCQLLLPTCQAQSLWRAHHACQGRLLTLLAWTLRPAWECPTYVSACSRACILLYTRSPAWAYSAAWR